MITTTIYGIGKLRNVFLEMPAKLTSPEAMDLYKRAGKIARDRARELCPYDPKRKRGVHLRDAIFVDARYRGKPSVLVGVNYRLAPHAHLVEYGTVRWAGKPFFRPAVAQTASTVRAMLRQGIAEIIAKQTMKGGIAE